MLGGWAKKVPGKQKHFQYLDIGPEGKKDLGTEGKKDLGTEGKKDLGTNGKKKSQESKNIFDTLDIGSIGLKR
jgi:hypothetical protein